MADVLGIYNYALGHLGSGVEVQAITERSAEARACTRFYEQTRDEVLRAFPWPFATAIVALALAEDDPTPAEWLYSYQVPSDCLMLRRIPSTMGGPPPTGVWTRNPILTQVVPYRRVGDRIYTDWVDAYLEYTQQVTDPTTFAPDFTQALAAKLAFYIAPRITGGDPFKLGNRAASLYLRLMAEAGATALNEENPDPPPESEFVQARE